VRARTPPPAELKSQTGKWLSGVQVAAAARCLALRSRRSEAPNVSDSGQGVKILCSIDDYHPAACRSPSCRVRVVLFVAPTLSV
jgi:hypothetical protein